MFIFWELVGVSSYLLIGFWYERACRGRRCKKAFITNRLGDFGFLLGIIMVWAALGSLQFRALVQDASRCKIPPRFGALATVAGLLIFCGAMGKSAQFPLHVWLPDAMEGPTPVSALIHAATMVAAGVYMLCRVFFLVQRARRLAGGADWLQGFSARIIAWIGGLPRCSRRSLRFSKTTSNAFSLTPRSRNSVTWSWPSVCEGPTAAMFHLTTHAFFKALLFLGAGSVIHALPSRAGHLEDGRR